MEAICENCEKVFRRAKSGVVRSKHHFCSQKCHYEWIKKSGIYRKENSAQWNSVQLQCDYCGKLFYRRRSRLKSEHHFCSLRCQAKWRKETGEITGGNNSRWSRVEVTCDNCRKRFFVERWKSGYKYHFCSRKCRIEWTKNAFKAEKNPNWQGGKSFEPYCVKFNEELKEKVREKYGRRCFLCSKTEAKNGRKLSVHHIDYDKDAGCNGKKWLLVPLCISCHSKTNSNRDYWESIIRAKMRKRKLSHSQTILDVFF